MIPKFRAWHEKEKKMYTGVLLIGQGKWALYKDTDITHKNFLGYFDDSILMESTGLKDKNGKEIFEGDILESVTLDGKVHRHDVLFYHGSFCFRNEIPRTKKKILSSMKHHCKEGTPYMIAHEVIGNIYENPELLEVKK